MGTHPIFESDFDCLTEWPTGVDSQRLSFGISEVGVIQTSLKNNRSKNLGSLSRKRQPNRNQRFPTKLFSKQQIQKIFQNPAPNKIRPQITKYPRTKHQKRLPEN